MNKKKTLEKSLFDERVFWNRVPDEKSLRMIPLWKCSKSGRGFVEGVL